jgi:hypothetical protein
MAKRLTIDGAVRRLHQENLQFKLVWDPEGESCILNVYDADKFVGGFWFLSGFAQESENDLIDLLTYVDENRAARAAEPKLVRV